MTDKKIEITKEEAKQVIFAVEFIYDLGFTDEELLILKQRLEKCLQEIKD